MTNTGNRDILVNKSQIRLKSSAYHRDKQFLLSVFPVASAVQVAGNRVWGHYVPFWGPPKDHSIQVTSQLAK